jgi:hypothetical protein
MVAVGRWGGGAVASSSLSVKQEMTLVELTPSLILQIQINAIGEYYTF